VGTVLAGGAFDPLHPGHLAYLQAAAAYGPVCVAVATDAYIQQVKGRPAFLSQSERCALILGLRGVAEVIAQNEYGEVGALETVRPAVYVKGADWAGRLPAEVLAACTRQGVTVQFVDTVRDSSSKRLAAYVTAIHEQGLGQLEALIASQKPASEPWQATPAVPYDFESRKKAEGIHPQLIKDVFQPIEVLDAGCGTGLVLVRLLQDLGVHTNGFDKQWAFGMVASGDLSDPRLWMDSILSGYRADLVVCRETLEHMTVAGIRHAVTNLCRLSSKFVYVTTRFAPQPAHLFDVQTSDDLDPDHRSMLPQTFLRSLFVLEGFRRRADLEERLDWMKKGRVLVYERG
jgi:cytidyltransferase-like protein